MSWLKVQQLRLITRFSTKQSILFGGRFVGLDTYSLQPQIIVGRDHCRYIGLDLAHVPKNKREQALKHQISAHSMWADVDYCVAWHAGFAQVWFWDAAAISALLQQSHKGFALARIQAPVFLAETVLREKPGDTGVYLFKCTNGYDLQNWQEGRLKASQWYAHSPGPQKINRFNRSQGLPCLQLRPNVKEVSRLESPWVGVVKPVWNNWFERKEKIGLALVLVFSLIACLQISSIVQWSIIERELQQDIVSLEGSANDLLAARRQARKAQLQISDLSKLFAMPDSLATQLKVYSRIPNELGLELKKWERNIDQIEITVEGEIVDTLSLVQALANDGITNVSVTRSRIKDRYNIRLMITSPRENHGGGKG